MTTSASYVSGDASTGVGTSGTARTATMYYDVRGNLIATHNPQAPHTVSAYDVMRRVTATAIYSATGGVDATVNPLTDDTLASGATIRLGASETFYDERGRVYKSTSYKVSQSTGADNDSLDSFTWYDSVGRAIKTGGTSLTKTYYDRLGRPTHRFTLARTDDTAYAHASDVSGDIVLQEDHTVYDDADKTGLVMMTGTILRNYDYLTAGALDSNADGNRYAYDLTGTPDVKGRIQITAMWYDTLDRPVDTVAYGNNGGSTDFDRRPSGSWLSAPTRSSTALRTTTSYDNWGRVDAVEQPRIRTGTTGYKNSYRYDHASRKVAEVRNDTAGSTSTALRDNDVYTRYTYSAGRMSTMWVDVDGDNVIDTDWSNLNNHDQVTEYFYGVDKTGTGAPTPPASTIASNRLLVQAKYPAQTNSKSTSQQSEYFAYNAQGQTTARTDQNGTVMLYEYDTGGRQTAQIADVLGTDIDVASGSNIDGAVRAIVTGYDSRGMVSTVTQTSDKAKSTIVDQVKNTYDEWGNLITFQQDYNGAVAGSSGDDLGVEYTNATDDLAAFNVYYAAGNNGGLGQISDTGIDNRKGLAGYEFDPILAGDGAIDGTGVPLYHVRNRVLNSYSGKWMQKDPLGYHDSMDLYEYCKSDPVDRSDFMGLASSNSCNSCCSSTATATAASLQPAVPAKPPAAPREDPCIAKCNAVCADIARGLGDAFEVCQNACLLGCRTTVKDCQQQCDDVYPLNIMPITNAHCRRGCVAGFRPGKPMPLPPIEDLQECLYACETIGRQDAQACQRQWDFEMADYRMACEVREGDLFHDLDQCSKWRMEIEKRRSECLAWVGADVAKCKKDCRRTYAPPSPKPGPI